MRAFALAALLVCAAGCLDITSPDGTLTCSNIPDRRCPHHFYCAWNNRCYRDGHEAPPMTDMAQPDLDLGAPDLGVPHDLSVPDLATPANLTEPPAD